MSMIQFPVIDPVATGANICRLRKDRGLTVRDLQHYFDLRSRKPSTNGNGARAFPV